MLCISCNQHLVPRSAVCLFCETPVQKSDNELSSEVIQLYDAYREYAKARSKLLSLLPRANSCRDPLSEFSEMLVATLLPAIRASSPVQKGYDLIRKNGRTVQVKCLANPEGPWKNFHTVSFNGDRDEYAIVFFVGFKLEAVIVFTREGLERVCQKLGKRHPNQTTTLQIYQRDFQEFLVRRTEFETIGVSIYRF